jgi:ABC-type sugar transport system permease subunit
VAPTVIVLTVFWLVPLVASAYLSFTKWSGLGDPEWIGLQNFRSLLEDDAFSHAAGNTLWFVVGSIATLVPIGLALALLLDSSRVRGRRFFEAILVLPVTTPVVVLSISFLLIFDERYGFANSVLGELGLGGVGWLSTTAWSKPTILMFVVWSSVGFTMLYYLAGLQSIPRDLIDAARVDGASSAQTIRHIIVPLLRPTTIFVVVVATINAIQIFAEPYIVTRGGPENSSLTATLLLYNEGFRFGKLGYASAIGLVIFAVTLAVSVVEMRLLGIFRRDQ